MAGAKKNGICGLGVLWGYGTRDELEALGSHACIGHPGELLLNFHGGRTRTRSGQSGDKIWNN